MEQDIQAKTTAQTISVLNALIGIWFIVSPYILSYATMQARWEQTIAGIIVTIAGIVRFFAPQLRWVSWITVAVAVWMIVAPFATGYEATIAFWNEIVFGILLCVLALWNTTIQPTAIQHRDHPSIR